MFWILNWFLFFYTVLLKNDSLSITHSLIDVLQEDFDQYAVKAKTLPDRTSNESKLILYGLYKQATVGPVNTSKSALLLTNSIQIIVFDCWVLFITLPQ